MELPETDKTALKAWTEIKFKSFQHIIEEFKLRFVDINIYEQDVDSTNRELCKNLKVAFDNPKKVICIVAKINDTKENTFEKDTLDVLYNSLIGEGILILAKLLETKLDPIVFNIKTVGFVNVRVVECLDGSKHIIATKPVYETGSAVQLKLKNKPLSMWEAGGINTDDEFEVINDEDLLNDDDYKKPAESSLRVCGTTGVRKACKNCSCGLADELEGENSAKNESNPKSSCGNCYLGDAFRCKSCPYLGMPAFKPGEKIQLSDDFLQPDI